MNENDLVRRGDVFDDLDWLEKNVCPSNVDGVMEMKKRIAQVEAVVSQSSTELAKDAVRNYKIGHGIRITQKPGDNPGCDEMWINRNIAACCIEIEEEAIVNACIRAAIEEKLDNLYLIDKQFVINALKEAMKPRQEEWFKAETPPNSGSTVFAYDIFGRMHFCLYDEGNYWELHGAAYDMVCNITHWMPKPEPPEEETK